MTIIEAIAVKTASSIISKSFTSGYSQIIKSELRDYEKELSRVIHAFPSGFSQHKFSIIILFRETPMLA